MSIVTVRRICQAFFLLLFLWFCVVSSFGTEWWQLRGWPVNWFLQLDPLVALGTVLTTGTLYAGLAWALVTIVLTILLGRFFCGWVCPLGSLHHLVGYFGKRGKSASHQVATNQYHRYQSFKYYLLFFLLSAATGTLLAHWIRAAFANSWSFWILVAATISVAAFAFAKSSSQGRKAASAGLGLIAVWAVVGFFFGAGEMLGASLQTGLLDPIPLVHRSVNLVLLALADGTPQILSNSQRYYEGAWVIGAIFLLIMVLNLYRPRFYCRFLCPLGALLGVMGRFSLWRIGKKTDDCRHCKLCEANCEGGCEPAAAIRTNECVLCMNCLHECKHDLITFSTLPSAGGEMVAPELSRREATFTLLSGIALLPMLNLSGSTARNYNPAVIRPPGALAEPEFLSRCLKCGQCMRICPTNIIQPAGLEAGPEGLWTPILNFRIGTSGCQLNCVACSLVCPTAAIRPLSLDEKRGLDGFASKGPMRIGTAFMDYGRCLPWAMDKPCIVCQENCPVSPKAIFVREFFSTIRDGTLEVKKAGTLTIEFKNAVLSPGQLATGDYHVRYLMDGESGPKMRVRREESGGERRLIVGNTASQVTIRPDQPFEQPPEPGTVIAIQVRLQRPEVDVKRCIGCGICEHECPVSGRRAIRVTAENESRSKGHSLLL
jgi:polyferredoxin/ferredoxin